MEVTIQTAVNLLGCKDYGLAGVIMKTLNHCNQVNGPEYQVAIIQEINQPYEAGVYTGKSGWQVLRESCQWTPGIKFGMWKKIYREASLAVQKPKRIGEILPTAVREIAQAEKIGE